MRLLIVATSRAARKELTRQAKAEGHQVTTLEPRRRLFHWSNRDVRRVVGNVLNPKSLANGVAGQHAVICWLNTPSPRKPTTYLSDGTANIVRAMYQYGVPKLICVSAFGVGDSRDHGGRFHGVVRRLLQKGLYEDLERQEQLLRYTDLSWIIVRPARVVCGKMTSEYMALTDLRNARARRISIADVVHFVIKQVVSDAYVHKTPLITY